MHEVEVLSKLQHLRRHHERAVRVATEAEAVLVDATNAVESTRERLADALKETRRVTGA
jgi:predicted  nucleic acid-binding Zn-ribbon protein